VPFRSFGTVQPDMEHATVHPLRVGAFLKEPIGLDLPTDKDLRQP